MKTFWVIQDADTKQYYWSYRIDAGFSSGISNAKQFTSQEDIAKEFSDDFFKEKAEGRMLEIKEIIQL